MYKAGMTKSKFKNKMRMFWTEQWKYELTPEMWVDLIHGHIWFAQHSGKINHVNPKRAMELLFLAIDKLMLEKKLDRAKAQTLRDMIRSQSEDDIYLAVCVMANLKPKKFKHAKNVEEVPEL